MAPTHWGTRCNNAKKSMLAQIVVGYALHEYPTVTEAGRNVLCNKSTATNYSRILVSLVW
jgi:hypothetical protein